jgi:hypothetical protein
MYRLVCDCNTDWTCELSVVSFPSFMRLSAILKTLLLLFLPNFVLLLTGYVF